VADLNNCTLPYDDDFFDAITFTEVIEHLEDHRKILKEINRALKKRWNFNCNYTKYIEYEVKD